VNGAEKFREKKEHRPMEGRWKGDAEKRTQKGRGVGQRGLERGYERW